MGIVDDDITKVREATDIVAIITQRVALKRVGRNWSGLCPFHDEKSPSFSVTAEKGLYHCFGCQKSGDAIRFVQETEQLDFQGAVEFLARKAGVTLHYTSPDEGGQRVRRRHLVEAVEKAVEFYHQRLLTGSDAGDARRYLRERGFDGDMVRRYRLGWAPDDWDQLVRHLRLSDTDLQASGLGRLNKIGRQQDLFRARVLFPIFDASGDPVGFGGRIMPGATGPKYLNTPECSVYHKGRLLYGLNWAKDAIVRHRTAGEVTGEAIVCEGYTDVVAFDRAEIGRAVATCGTALTEDHVRLLRRFASRIVLAFDADEAGQGAAARFYEWERKYELEVAVADLPAGVDPDELSRTDPARLRAAVENAVPFLSFRVDRVFRSDLSTPERRARAAEAAVDAVREHPSSLVRDQYLMTIADRCQVEVDRLRELMAAPARPSTAAGNPRPDPAHRSRETEPPPWDDEPPPWSNESPSGDRRSRSTRPAARPIGSPIEPEDEALRWMVTDPDRIVAFLHPSLFASDPHREAFEALRDRPDLHAAVESMSPVAADLAHRAAVTEPSSDPVELASRLADLSGNRTLRTLERDARQTSDMDELRTYTDAITWLKHQIEGLRDVTSRSTALGQLVPWLGQHGAGRDDG